MATVYSYLLVEVDLVSLQTPAAIYTMMAVKAIIGQAHITKMESAVMPHSNLLVARDY